MIVLSIAEDVNGKFNPIRLRDDGCTPVRSQKSDEAKLRQLPAQPLIDSACHWAARLFQIDEINNYLPWAQN